MMKRCARCNTEVPEYRLVPVKTAILKITKLVGPCCAPVRVC